MAWIESHEEIWEHHKIYRLCTAVNQPDYAVVGRLMSLWHFVLKNAWRDANLEPWGDDGIERASRWDGEKGAWVTALRECGFLDGFTVHGWQKRAGRLVQDRRRNERRKGRRVTGGKPAVKRTHTAGKLAATLPYPTVPNHTLPGSISPPGENPKDASEKSPKELTDIQKVVTAFKIVSGSKDDPLWDKVYFPRFTKSAKALMDFLGNWEDAADCIQDIYEKFKAKGLTVTLETVVKHASDWKKDRQERRPTNGVFPVPSYGSR